MEKLKPTVLVVDDNEMNRDLLSRMLEIQKYEAVTARDGKVALDTLKEDPKRFDLVLLDIMMPEMDGYEVLKRLKADDELKHIPVIVISALDDVKSVVKGIELGAEDYVPKPFDRVLMEARVSSSLERKLLRDSEMDHLKQVQYEKSRSEALLDIVIPIGVALSREKDFDKLLENIVLEAMSLCNADGGTMYLRTEDNHLRYVIMRNQSLELAQGGTTGTEITPAPLPLVDASGQIPNHNYVATSVFLKNATANIPDVYLAGAKVFSGTKEMDKKLGYRVKSMLAIPLSNDKRHVIGILQLINALDSESGAIIPFSEHMQELMEALALLATVALEAYQRKELLESKIEELEIQLDEARKVTQVEQITETEYFQKLQKMAKDLKRKGATSGAEKKSKK